MKALFVQWGIQMADIPAELIKLNVEVDIYPEEVAILEYRMEEMQRMCGYLKAHMYDFVITNNFVRTVSDACQSAQVKYAAWIFDSPQIDLYTKPAGNQVNYIFAFDKKQCERMKAQGLQKVFHLPLAVSTERIAALRVTEEDVNKYSGDLSFVGMLYEDNHYNRDSGRFTKEEKAYLDAIIMRTALHWGEGYSPFCSISEEMSRTLQTYAVPWKQYEIDLAYFHELYYIVRKVTEIERICILNGLALQHKVDLYTISNTLALQNVRIHGGVSYNEELPKIYHLSRINLNITMRSIETGAPQRIFDIMGAGGFVISNYQKELEELFVPDEEIVLFRNMEELITKVNYYLNHEQERIRIAVNGFRKVMECYQYKTALSKIIAVMKDVDAIP